jgi:hypothetical protein
VERGRIRRHISRSFGKVQVIKDVEHQSFCSRRERSKLCSVAGWNRPADVSQWLILCLGGIVVKVSEASESSGVRNLLGYKLVPKPAQAHPVKPPCAPRTAWASSGRQQPVGRRTAG